MKRKKPLIVGLTGSIGMGKSAVARMFAALGAPVFDADRTVHALLQPGGKAFARVAKLFPQALSRGRIDKKKLGQLVFDNQEGRKQLEGVLHPLVWKARTAFLKDAARQQKCMVVLEIPLLFETGEDRRCDVTVCVSAKAAQQKERVLSRKGMTPQKFRAIVKSQWPNRLKIQAADHIIRTDKDLKDTKRQVRALWAAWNKEE